MILALAGGVGGARMASALAGVLAADRLTVVVNVGDDFTHLGLKVSPDLDTVMYTLAGLHNPATGWGRVDETWNFMQALASLGGANWFQLGDRDLAVHVERTRRLAAGEPLSAITADFCKGLGIAPAVVPVTDEILSTMVGTSEGELAFQDYFVRLRCEPRVSGFRFAGAERAALSAPLARLLASGNVEAVVLCPSNPWLSIAPLLAVAPLREFIAAKRVPVVAVSPIVAGSAVKGPAAKIMRELGVETSVMGVVGHYGALVDGWVIAAQDAGHEATITASGRAVSVVDTLMTTPEKSRGVAAAALALCTRIAAAR